MAGLVSSMSTVSGTVGQCLAKEGEGVCVGGGGRLTVSRSQVVAFKLLSHSKWAGLI